MSETITNEDLQELQMQITQALQNKVLSQLSGNYKPYLESVGFSIELLGRLKTITEEPDERGMAAIGKYY